MDTLLNYKALWTTNPLNPVKALNDITPFKYLKHNTADEAHIFLVSPELQGVANLCTVVQPYPDIFVVLVPNVKLKGREISLFLEGAA